jgi:hypothetical protein
MVLFIYNKNFWHNLDGYIKKKKIKDLSNIQRDTLHFIFEDPLVEAMSTGHVTKVEGGGWSSGSGGVSGGGRGVLVAVVVGC